MRHPDDARITADGLVLEPLRVDHAEQLAGLLADPALYTFTGGEPPTVDELRRRYAAQVVGHSADGRQTWLNWVVRDARTLQPLGFVQATVEGAGAELAWVVGTGQQSRGVATAAATAMVGWLRDHDVDRLTAHVHPHHLASAAVARRLGLVVTGRLVDGEVEWQRPAVEPPSAVRPARPDDLPGLLGFWAVAAEDSHRPPDSHDALVRLVGRDPQALLVATVGDVLVGTVIAGFDGWRCHLYRLAVHPTFRRRGIARALVTAAERRFVALGASRADAMVLDGNTDAHTLWSGLGYRRQAEWSRWVTAVRPAR